MSQTVLITGSSSGFGLLTVRTLLEKGHTVFATMRDPSGRNTANASDLHAFEAEAEVKHEYWRPSRIAASATSRPTSATSLRSWPR